RAQTVGRDHARCVPDRERRLSIRRALVSCEAGRLDSLLLVILRGLVGTRSRRNDQSLTYYQFLRIVDHIAIGIENLFPTRRCFVKFSGDRCQSIAALHHVSLPGGFSPFCFPRGGGLFKRSDVAASA